MNSPLPSSPIYFLKPDTSILRTKNFYYPKFTKSLHYECEVVIKIEKVGKNIQEKYAHTYYSEFTWSSTATKITIITLDDEDRILDYELSNNNNTLVITNDENETYTYTRT